MVVGGLLATLTLGAGLGGLVLLGHAPVRAIPDLDGANAAYRPSRRWSSSGLAPVGPLPRGLSVDAKYRKHADAGGIPVLAPEAVPDASVSFAAEIVTRMLAHRPDVQRSLVLRRARVALFGPEERITDIPEFRHLTAKDMFKGKDPNSFAGIASNAKVEGVAAAPPPGTWPGAKWSGEPILVHEVAHVIRSTALDTLGRGEVGQKILYCFRGARLKKLYEGTYADENSDEYWASVSEVWWDVSGWNLPEHVKTRADLRRHDPEICAVLASVYGDD